MKVTTLFCALFGALLVGCAGSVPELPDAGGPTDASFFDHNYFGCTNDVDCANNGTACGTYVCSWANPDLHLCVPATSNPGWCGDPNLDQAAANLTCKCHAEGATCNIVTNFCTFVAQ